MALDSIYNFQNLSNKLPTIFNSLIFRDFPPQVRLFFVEKENLIFGFQYAMEAGIRKIRTL